MPYEPSISREKYPRKRHFRVSRGVKGFRPHKISLKTNEEGGISARTRHPESLSHKEAHIHTTTAGAPHLAWVKMMEMKSALFCRFGHVKGETTSRTVRRNAVDLLRLRL